MLARFTPNKKRGHSRTQSAGVFTDASKGLVTVNMMEHQATPRPQPVLESKISSFEEKVDPATLLLHLLLALLLLLARCTADQPSVAPTPDLSLDASHERRRLRRASLSPGMPRRLSLSPMNALADKIASVALKEDGEPVPEDMTGYLMKQNPQKKWQRRWFALRTVMFAKGSRREWRSALVWHKDIKSSVNNQLFIDEIVGDVTFVKTPPGHFDANNVFVFEKGAGISGEQKNMFKLTTRSMETNHERTYMFQASTIAEMVSWVSGLRRAVESVRASRRKQHQEKRASQTGLTPQGTNAEPTAPTPAIDASTQLEGALLKQSGKMKSWNKRWFRLHRGIDEHRKIVLDWRKDKRSPVQKSILVENIVFVSFSVSPPGRFTAGAHLSMMPLLAKKMRHRPRPRSQNQTGES